MLCLRADLAGKVRLQKQGCVKNTRAEKRREPYRTNNLPVVVGKSWGKQVFLVSGLGSPGISGGGSGENGSSTANLHMPTQAPHPTCRFLVLLEGGNKITMNVNEGKKTLKLGGRKKGHVISHIYLQMKIFWFSCWREDGGGKKL